MPRLPSGRGLRTEDRVAAGEGASVPVDEDRFGATVDYRAACGTAPPEREEDEGVTALEAAGERCPAPWPAGCSCCAEPRSPSIAPPPLRRGLCPRCADRRSLLHRGAQDALLSAIAFLVLMLALA
ncbi:hypothetical protein ADK34_39580 [Streptomyces viridochromogenes]|uniref:Uncharacterized protein n=1 Tax=Streptomyces viridochromogenes TaxID=1938 RepID=A0A0L8J381_STRVR|nr:hypothetical protein ADK34_39580 [Streptomyces viridochromogenes]